MTSRTAIAAVGVALSLAACSGGADSTTTPEGIAEQAGCSGFKVSTTEELGVQEQGQCALNGDDVIINTFSNNDARDTWVQAARQFGGPYFAGDRFVAYSDGNPDTTESLGQSLEGEIVR